MKINNVRISRMQKLKKEGPANMTLRELKVPDTYKQARALYKKWAAKQTRRKVKSFKDWCRQNFGMTRVFEKSNPPTRAFRHEKLQRKAEAYQALKRAA